MDGKVIVALDVPSMQEAAQVVSEIGEEVSFYKVGLELFIADGPAVLHMLKEEGKNIFLDLKLHDIPRTVERAVSSCIKFGVDMLTVHSSGATAMVASAAAAVRTAGADTKILAVTVLTSLDDKDLHDVGVSRPMEEQVCALGKLAVDSGADGLICSPREVVKLRQTLGQRPVLVTPGVRPAGENAGDQKRIATPERAIADGASYVVVGRPIVQAADRRAAAKAINSMIASI